MLVIYFGIFWCEIDWSGYMKNVVVVGDGGVEIVVF